MDDEVNQRAVRYTRRLRREIRAVVDPYQVADSVFMNYFRLSKDLARLLIREVTPFMRPGNYSSGIPITNKVLCCLNFYASGSYQGQIGANWINCMGRSTVGFCIREVTEALNNRALQLRWIKFPSTRAERQQLRERHQQAFKIPGVVGFVDGTEVSIVTPSNELNPQSFWTRKHHYALNCQIVCDSNLVILNVNASYAGSCRDAFIFKFSPARRRIKEAFQEDQSSWFLGDGGYANEPWMMLPLKHAPPGTPEAYYTELHCKARCCVERCIGVLKGRFRCLLKDRVLHYSPQMAGKIVKACCLLHNMCRMAGIRDDLLEIVEGEEDGIPWVAPEGFAELEAMEDEEPDDPALQIRENANLLQISRVVQQRIVDFLQMERLGLLD